MQSAYASGSWIPAQACVKLRYSKAKLTTETYYYNCFDNTGGGGGGGGDNSRFALPIPRIIIKTAAAGGHVKSITSTSNPFVKHCLKLQQNSSYRHSHASALVVGSTPIREIHRSQESLQERTVELEYLLLLDEAEVSQVLDDKSSARVVRVSSVVMKKLSQLQSTESVDAIALMKFPTTYFVVDNHQDCSRKWFPSPHRILVLEGIQDPGNLGTLLRSALALGWTTGWGVLTSWLL